MPNGWPIAIEPPLTFSLSIRNAEPIAAVDHLRGERFVQLPHVDVVDAKARVAATAWEPQNTGPMPISSGSQPATRVAAEDEQRLDARAPSRDRIDMTRVADAPSGQLRRVAGRHAPLPARRCRTRAAASPVPRASCRARLHSSRSDAHGLLSRSSRRSSCRTRARVTSIGAISPSKKPSRCARAVRCWLDERVLVLSVTADAVRAWRQPRPSRP